MMPERSRELIKRALAEDRARKDITTRALPFKDTRARAFIRSQQTGILAGGPVAAQTFREMDRRLRVRLLKKDGARLRLGERVLEISGPLGSILSAERTALNFLYRLSGIASLTDRYVQAVRGTGAKIYDTRKTTPGLRALEKYAVRCGGGENHRMDLASSILLKDNHIQAMKKSGRPLSEMLARLRRRWSRGKRVQMEAQSLEEVWDGIVAGVDIILLDNLRPAILEKAMELIRAARETTGPHRPLAEVSGGVNLSNVKATAQLGPDRISVGELTHSPQSLNFSLEIL